jgi:branched-chain amino acid transport system substrate-binding protein
MKVKLSTIANWTQSFGSQFANSPSCLAKTFIDGSSWNYADTAGNPEVAAFNNDIKRYFPSEASQETQWMLEGYAAADSFTEAAKSCGQKLTRACVESFMNHTASLNDDGLMNPLTSYVVRPPSYYSQPTNQCVSVVQWSTSAGTWVNRATFDKDCFSAPGYSYALPQPS